MENETGKMVEQLDKKLEELNASMARADTTYKSRARFNRMISVLQDADAETLDRAADALKPLAIETLQRS